MLFKVTLYEVRPSLVDIGDCFEMELTSFEFQNIQEANLFAELCAKQSTKPLKISITAETMTGAAEELVEETKKQKDELGGTLS